MFAGFRWKLRISKMSQTNPSAAAFSSGTFSWAWVRQIGYSVADQGFSVGGMFLLNIALARTRTKDEYGIFALSYSVYTFLAGLHNAAILEAYTIYGSGRYHQRLTAYAWLLWSSNRRLALGTAAVLTVLWGALAWALPAMASRTVLGLALSCGVLLTASFVRRTFYMRRGTRAGVLGGTLEIFALGAGHRVCFPNDDASVLLAGGGVPFGEGSGGPARDVQPGDAGGAAFWRGDAADFAGIVAAVCDAADGGRGSPVERVLRRMARRHGRLRGIRKYFCAAIDACAVRRKIR